RLLMLLDIVSSYYPDTRKGVIGMIFNGQYNSVHLGARGFFDNKKFNLYMGAGALGAAINDFAPDNFDHSDLDFLGGGAIEIRQYGDGAITSNKVPDGTPRWGKEFKKNSIFYAHRSLQLWYTPIVMSWWHDCFDLDL